MLFLFLGPRISLWQEYGQNNEDWQSCSVPIGTAAAETTESMWKPALLRVFPTILIIEVERRLRSGRKYHLPHVVDRCPHIVQKLTVVEEE